MLIIVLAQWDLCEIRDETGKDSGFNFLDSRCAIPGTQYFAYPS